MSKERKPERAKHLRRIGNKQTRMNRFEVKQYLSYLAGRSPVIAKPV